MRYSGYLYQCTSIPMTDLKELIGFARNLSRRDRKTTTEKLGKGMEEMGELARAVLPWDSAHGTLHRVPNRNAIIEECVDSALVLLSILEDVEATDEEIANMLDRKSRCWEFLLDNEDKSDATDLAFEVHITVADAEIDQFARDCHELNVKPIILDLYTSGATIKDVMTSSTIRGSTKDAVRYTKNLSQKLSERNYTVVREKIETVPWHPAALVPAATGGYYETHFAFTGDRDALSVFCADNDIHLSRNNLKKGDNAVIMGTYRDRTDGPRPFEDKVAGLVHKISQQGAFYLTKKPIVEYSISDSKEDHDGKWIA